MRLFQDIFQPPAGLGNNISAADTFSQTKMAAASGTSSKLAVGPSIMTIAARALMVGLTTTGLSWVVLKREDAVQLFGMSMRHVTLDVVLMTLGSIVNDTISSWAIPALENLFNEDRTDVRKFINFNTTSVGTAGFMVLGKSLSTAYSSKTYAASSGAAKRLGDFMLGYTIKASSDYLLDTLPSTIPLLSNR